MRKLMTCCGLALLLACGKVYEETQIPNTFQLEPGAELRVRLVQPSAIETWKPGGAFAGVLTEPLYYTRHALDSSGKTLERKTLIAPEGAPVEGVVVRGEGPFNSPDGLGLRLTAITLHGGRSYPVTTEPVIGVDPKESGPWTFKLSEPAEVALVIEYQGDGKPRRVKL